MIEVLIVVLLCVLIAQVVVMIRVLDNLGKNQGYGFELVCRDRNLLMTKIETLLLEVGVLNLLLTKIETLLSEVEALGLQVEKLELNLKPERGPTLLQRFDASPPGLGPEAWRRYYDTDRENINEMFESEADMEVPFLLRNRSEL